MQVDEAQAHAAAGGQALHLHTIIPNPAKAPGCFVAAVGRGEWIAHLFDQDVRRLRATAEALGVRVIVVERRGQPGQHVDLCGKPLGLALAQCENKTTTPRRPPWCEDDETPSLFPKE